MAQRALVVDDDADIRETLSELLCAEGYDVVTAANGAEALSALDGAAAPELVLLDLMMPVLDGCGFLHHAPPDVAANTLVMTAMSQRDVNAFLTENPIAIRGMVQKPFTLEDLFAILNGNGDESEQVV